ncbi:hypothetical protein SAMN05216266_102321 [Amycolatopsis marina]|uniref:Uncharacterized protein n=1 Tax=Amycolatopsis marina TaxID=490629 RepID=A0A1I0X0M2_9PSEU|nr:hypothetical protein [Amycolatopsis marina]SFA93683.1 hypothetical protein SAMN05216266_102321 [Amycolatopsis marina]
MRDLVSQARPDVLAELGTDGLLRLRSTRRPHLGHLQVEPYIEGTRILLRPVAARISRLRVLLPARTRPIPVDLPDLPGGLRLTGIGTAPAELTLYGVTDYWRDRLATIPLSTLLGAVTSAVSTLTVPWLGES